MTAFAFTLRTCLVAAIACWASLASVMAIDLKPDAAIKNRNVEANLFLDDKIKAAPALAADCLAEGKKWIDKNAAETNASRKQDPQLFHDGGWSFERKYDTRSVVDGHYVSIVRSDYMDTHAAHPNSDVNTILWDAAQNKRISIRPFFTETADGGATMKAMVKAVLASLTDEKKKRDAGETAVNYAKDAYANSGDTFRDGSQAVAKTVQERPLGALLVAGGIGFALAMLMTRPPRRPPPRWRYYG